MTNVADASLADPNSKTGHPLTLTHAHFLIMGGFTVRFNDDPEDQYVLIGDDLDKRLVDASNNESALIRDLICQVKVASLQDRSKGDVISKGLAAVQAGWFILSSITRGVSGLALTELEVSTLAFAMISLVLYILWWDKPQSVGIQVLIHPSLKLITNRASLEQQDEVLHAYDLLATPLGIIARSQWRTQSRAPSMWWTNSELELDLGTVESQRRIVLPSAIIGLFFGAVHCIAWKFYFPTMLERTLWRVCAVAVGIGPGLVLLLTIIFWFLVKRNIISKDLYFWLLMVLGLILPYLAFFTARTGLLVLSLTTLREIPSSAYQTVPWLSYIPHI